MLKENEKVKFVKKNVHPRPVFNPVIQYCLSVIQEYAKSIQAYIEYTANLGMFAVHKIISEYKERSYAYKEKAQRYTKLTISVNNGPTWQFFKFIYFYT
jgi:hypothetical protein